MTRPLRAPDAAELPPLVPRSSLAVIDEAVNFLRISPALLFGVALIVLLPLRVMALAFPGSPLRDARPDQLLDVFIGNVSEPGAVVAAFALRSTSKDDFVFSSISHLCTFHTHASGRDGTVIRSRRRATTAAAGGSKQTTPPRAISTSTPRRFP